MAFRTRWRPWIPWLWVFAPIVCAAIAYVVVEPPTTDLAAQTFRSELFDAHGLLIWNNFWYGGHYLLGYSVLFPPLAATLGVAEVGAVAAVIAAMLFALLVQRDYSAHARLATLWFGAGAIAIVLSGRLTFALGVAIGVGALLALSRGRLVPAALLAAATSCASPVAGFFLLVFGASLVLTGHRLKGVVLGACAVAPLAFMLILFPVEGAEPFVASSFWGGLAVILLVLLVLPRGERLLRLGTALYAGTVVLAFLIPNALGGNVVRLSNLAAGPVVALAVSGPRRRLILALVALPLLYWQWQPAFRDVFTVRDEPSVEQSFYAPLLAQLRARTAGIPVRIEVPPTQHRWEARYVAPEFPLARGWERQRESDDFDLFNEDLSPPTYLSWLQSNGVSYVALANVELDYLAQQEATLIRHGLPYLTPVWSNEDWRLFAVRDPSGLTDGSARVTSIGPDWFEVRVDRPGRSVLRIHYNRYWKLDGVEACLREEGPWSVLEAHAAGTVQVSTDFSFAAPRGRDQACSPPGSRD
ncbi:MAG TPA: hypothetical protein VIE64_05360 [Solirubrobacterales bacterium]|jgi:hypothetical protein